MKLKLQTFLAVAILCLFWALSGPVVLAGSDNGLPAAGNVSTASLAVNAPVSAVSAAVPVAGAAPAAEAGLSAPAPAGAGSVLPITNRLPGAPERAAKPVLYLPVVYRAGALQPDIAPQTGQPAAPPAGEAADQRLAEFIEAVKSPKREGLITGLYAPDVLAYSVVQQPSSNSIFVSTEEDQVTQFRRAARSGSIGMLAHNYLAGKSFYKLELGARLYVIQWDGSYQAYEVYAIEDYQALTLTTFRTVGEGKFFDQYALFNRIYKADNDRLVLQTCLEKGGNLSWGRRFILARPVEATS